MIEYALRCTNEHRFSGWFKNAEAFEKQKQASSIKCPTCGDTQIEKTLQTPHIGNKAGRGRGDQLKRPQIPLPSQQVPSSAVASASKSATQAATPNKGSASTPINAAVSFDPTQVTTAAKALPPAAAEAYEKLYKAAVEIRKTVEKHCDDVGKDFAEEARKIHYGETEERGIYGQVSKRDAEDLIDEGISIAPLPTLPKKNS